MKFSNKVDWTIEPERCALLVHDMQPHFLNALPQDSRARIVANARDICDASARRGIPIFASHVPKARRLDERGLMADIWGPGPAAAGFEPALGLDAHHARPLVKRSYSAFYGNDFEPLLRRLGRDALLIVGVYTSIGCHYSAVDAFSRDIKAFLVADAVADIDEADHSAGLSAMAKTCAKVVATSDVIDALAPKKPRRRLPDSYAYDVC
ncbi:bifunctional isochorismate lyase/aryl carrier protein [Rhodoblastus acidophilus]|uniref:isochorismatase family protein n=1 Tax=Rhodoblastus acidophilus TaxID=1074 RepID=UPI0018B085D1|nr:isochorismatase family protein [Rhodoblastus acidophilus]MCW2274320.1 bifunctional isochorismate lyase/aryl carrier protein [Rhodoblastus acidophilus]